MKVLIWVDQFPMYSETFIRDQVVQLKRNNVEMKIFCNFHNDKEILSLNGFEEFELLQDRIFLNDLMVKNKINRFLKVASLLFKSFFTPDFNIYIKSLNFFIYGREALTLSHFYMAVYLLKNKINVIHAHYGTNGNKAAVYKEIGVPLKLYTTFHGYDIRLGIKQGGRIYDKLFEYADGIISIARYNKEHLLNFGANKLKIIDLPNGIDTSFFKRKIPVSLNGEIRILSVARLSPEKGLSFFLKALKNYLDKNQNLKIKYNIIGDGPLRIEFQKFIDENYLTEIVNLLGVKNSSEVKEYMINSDIFVLPSLTEVLPTVLLEAQSCALPILATNVGAVEDMTSNAIIVEPNDIDALCKGLNEIINIRSEWSVFGEAQRKYVYDNFEINGITKQLLNYY